MARPAVEVLHAPFMQTPLSVVDSGEIPHLQFAPCTDECARCDVSLGGFKFPFIGAWCRRAVLVQEGVSARRPGPPIVAEAGSGLHAQDGRVESGDLPFVSFRGFMGTWRRWSLGSRSWTEPWRLLRGAGRREEEPPSGRVLRLLRQQGSFCLRIMWHPPRAKPAPSVAAKALRSGVLLLAMAFRGDATPGRYATEAMEHSGGNPRTAGEGLLAYVSCPGGQCSCVSAEARADAGLRLRLLRRC